MLTMLTFMLIAQLKRLNLVPFGCVPIYFIAEVLDVMKSIAKDSGTTMVVVTHEMGFAAQGGSRLIFMDDGRIVEEGKPAEVMLNPQSERLKDFLGHVKHH